MLIEVIYKENVEIEKIAFIVCSRKSLKMYSHIEASVLKFRKVMLYF